MPPDDRDRDREAGSSLAATQAALMSLITGQPARGLPRSAESLVVGDGRADAAGRVHVYAHMYEARLLEALESQFPRLARHLGGKGFAAVALAYTSEQPSRNPSLRFIGQRLPAWLERSHPERPWLADLARLEWARADVFDAADEETLSLEALRVLPPQELAALPLRLIRARRVVLSDHALAAFWTQIGGGDPAVDIASDGVGEPPAASEGDAGEWLLVWRQETVVYHRAVAADELSELEKVDAGTTFGAVCERLFEILPASEATTRAFTWLSTWASDGLLSRAATPP